MEKNELTQNEKKKKYLMEYKVAKRDVVRLEEQLTELQISEMYPSSMVRDDMPHAHNQTDLSDYAVKVEELVNEIWAARYRRINAFQQIQHAIEDMEDEREKTLLTYRYLRGYEWERIAVEMGVTWRHTLRIHGSALRNFNMS